jgi:chromosome segregation ATPase
MSKAPVVKLSPYEMALNRLNDLPRDLDRIFTAALGHLRRERDEARAEVERLMHQLADATNESTHFQVMCKREGEEIERLTRQVELLTDERDELLVRVANQEAELRATREAYLNATNDRDSARDTILEYSTALVGRDAAVEWLTKLVKALEEQLSSNSKGFKS